MATQMCFWNLVQFSGSIGSFVGVGTKALPNGSSLTAVEEGLSVDEVGARMTPFSAASWLGSCGVCSWKVRFSAIVHAGGRKTRRGVGIGREGDIYTIQDEGTIG